MTAWYSCWFNSKETRSIFSMKGRERSATLKWSSKRENTNFYIRRFYEIAETRPIEERDFRALWLGILLFRNLLLLIRNSGLRIILLLFANSCLRILLLLLSILCKFFWFFFCSLLFLCKFYYKQGMQAVGNGLKFGKQATTRVSRHEYTN